MNILKKITVDDKESLLKGLKRGKNSVANIYGTYDSSTSGHVSPQKYNHNQKNPIIIRGE
jgi:hypothetical protein